MTSQRLARRVVADAAAARLSVPANGRAAAARRLGFVPNAYGRLTKQLALGTLELDGGNIGVQPRNMGELGYFELRNNNLVFTFEEDQFPREEQAYRAGARAGGYSVEDMRSSYSDSDSNW